MKSMKELVTESAEVKKEMGVIKTERNQPKKITK